MEFQARVRTLGRGHRPGSAGAVRAIEQAD